MQVGPDNRKASRYLKELDLCRIVRSRVICLASCLNLYLSSPKDSSCSKNFLKNLESRYLLLFALKHLMFMLGKQNMVKKVSQYCLVRRSVLSWSTCRRVLMMVVAVVCFASVYKIGK
jgi:hypothetical protein